MSNDVITRRRFIEVSGAAAGAVALGVACEADQSSGLSDMGVEAGLEDGESGDVGVGVDVEGSELDVFVGLGELLKEKSCRAVFCEVHFGLLAERGQPYASKEIEKLLAESGLSEQSWLDASHLMALRPAS